MSLADLIEYRRLSAQAKKIFKTKKIEKFKEFSSTINFKNDKRYVWNTCKILKNKWIKINSQHTSQNLQNNTKVTTLNKICPPWVPTDPNYLPNCKTNDFLGSDFTFEEFFIALQSKNSKSSPGMDGIDYDVIKKLPGKFHLILLNIFNEMLKTGDYPNSWKHAYLHFIAKSDGINFRPIALTSALCKLFETILKNKLQWWVETESLLPNDQSGFRKGRSSIENIVNLSLYVQKAFATKKGVHVAFLDVCGAFDNVNVQILIEKLAQIGLPLPIIQFIKFITYERRIYSSISNDYLHTYKGVPQGGVLSPLLYTLYVSDITETIPKSVQISQFADDITLYSKNVNSLERSITCIEKSLSKIGLDLAPSKTIYIYFNNKNILPGDKHIDINGLVIKSSESAKFLGVTFDYKLLFTQHIRELEKKCLRALNIIRYLQGIWWGADPNTLLTLYKSYIRSILDYGIQAYYPNRKNLQMKIERIQYAAIRTALGYRRSTPNNILLTESKLPLISYRAEYLSNIFILKVLSNESLPIFKTINNYFNNYKNFKKKKRFKLFETCIRNTSALRTLLAPSKHYDIYNYDYSINFTSIPYDRSLGDKLKRCENPNELLSNILSKENAVAIFTDGSKSPTSPYTGAACICPKFNINLGSSLNKNASVFTAECCAIKDALLTTLNNTSLKYYIFTDSLNTLQNLNNHNISIETNRYILEIKKLYSQFFSTTTSGDIKLFWIPAHIGISGNELADLIAKNSSLSSSNYIHFTPIRDLRNYFKEYMYKISINNIKKTFQSKGQKYFQFYYTEKTKPWFHNKKLPRDLIVTVNRCRSDHYHLKASLYRINIISDPSCPCGFRQQNLNHIIWNCPLLDTERTSLMYNLQHFCKIKVPCNINTLLIEPNVNACIYIHKFLKNCNIKV